MNSKTIQEYHEELAQAPPEKVWEIVQGYFPIKSKELAKRVCPPLLKRFKQGERGDIIKVFQLVDTYSPLIDFYDKDIYEELTTDFKISHFFDLVECMPNWWEYSYANHLNNPSEKFHAFRLLNHLMSMCPLEDLDRLVRIEDLRPLPGHENNFLSRLWPVFTTWMSATSVDEKKLELALNQTQKCFDSYPNAVQKLRSHWLVMDFLKEHASADAIKSLLTFFSHNQIKITKDFWKVPKRKESAQTEQRFQAVYNRVEALGTAEARDAKIHVSAASILWEELSDLIKTPCGSEKAGFSLSKTWGAWCLLSPENKPGEFPIADLFINGWIEKSQISDWFILANHQINVSTLIRDVKNESVLQELLNEDNIALFDSPTDYKFKETLLLSVCEYACNKGKNWLGPLGAQWLLSQIQDWADNDASSRISFGGFSEDAAPRTKERRASFALPMPSLLKIWDKREEGYWGSVAGHAIVKAMLNGKRKKFFNFHSEMWLRLGDSLNTEFILKAREILVQRGEDLCSMDAQKDFLTYINQGGNLDWCLDLGPIPFEKSVWFVEWGQSDEEKKNEFRSKLAIDCPVWMKNLEEHELKKKLLLSVKAVKPVRISSKNDSRF